MQNKQFEQRLFACQDKCVFSRATAVQEEVQTRTDCTTVTFSFPTPRLDAERSWLPPALPALHWWDIGLEVGSFNRRRQRHRRASDPIYDPFSSGKTSRLFSSAETADFVCRLVIQTTGDASLFRLNAPTSNQTPHLQRAVNEGHRHRRFHVDSWSRGVKNA